MTGNQKILEEPPIKRTPQCRMISDHDFIWFLGWFFLHAFHCIIHTYSHCACSSQNSLPMFALGIAQISTAIHRLACSIAAPAATLPWLATGRIQRYQKCKKNKQTPQGCDLLGLFGPWKCWTFGHSFWMHVGECFYMHSSQVLTHVAHVQTPMVYNHSALYELGDP